MVCAIILENVYPYNGGSAGWYSTNVLEYTLNNVKIHYVDKKGFLLATGY